MNSVFEKIDSVPDIKSFFQEDQFGDAKLFFSIFKDRVIYCPSKCFYYWDGAWKKDNDNTVKTLVPQHLPDIYKRLNDSNLYNDIHRRIKQLRMNHYIRGIIDQCKHFLFNADFEKSLDTSSRYIGVENGVLDLTTGNLLPNQPSYRIFHRIPVEWKGLEYEAPLFEKSLNEIINNQDIDFFQKVLGHALTGVNTYHLFLVFLGETHTGKSFLINLIQGLLTYKFAKPMSKSVLLSLQTTEGHHSSHLVDLCGAKIATYSEVSSATKINEMALKSITGEDTITMRPIYGSEFQYKLNFLPILITNFTPQLSVNDDALWKRLVFIPFNTDFSENPDRQLCEKLLNRERSGILAWLVRGAIDVHTNGLIIPPHLLQNTQEQRDVLDTLDTFLLNYMKSTKKTIPAHKLYNDYRQFCNSNKYPLQLTNITQFGSQMKKKDILRQRTAKGRVYSLVLI